MTQLPAAAADHLIRQDVTSEHPADRDLRWWRSSVIYQIYPRSFRDLNGDGIGDLAGITAELENLADLDIDAIWLSPFYTSPQRDGGYDVSDYCDIDPIFGSLTDFDQLIEQAHGLGIKVIIDLVPNHCSSEHPLFQAALAAGPASRERDMFMFRDGRGEHGELPPNNWQSHFGGPAWSRVQEADGSAGQWYLHLFDSSQPDFNWGNEQVHAEFERILHFWLQRGVNGFRVDVAHALVKAKGLPDWGGRADGSSSDGFPGHEAPMFGQPELHAIYRRWRQLLDSYGNADGEDRIMCAEASVDPLPRLAHWVRPDEMHQAFNFAYLSTGWDADGLRTVITDSLAAFDTVGAPTTWVLSNHDVVRHATRYGFGGPLPRGGDGIGPSDVQPDTAVGLSRARAASLLMLALPGGVYLYQGEELGLPDHTTMAAQLRQDPSYARTHGERLGRDGCRVPLPWTAAGDSCGFSHSGLSWLPQPDSWNGLSRQSQRNDDSSTLTMYRHALHLRRQMRLGSGSLSFQLNADNDIVSFINGGVLVVMNMGVDVVHLPVGQVLASSEPGAGHDGLLQPNQSVWLELA